MHQKMFLHYRPTYIGCSGFLSLLFFVFPSLNENVLGGFFGYKLEVHAFESFLVGSFDLLAYFLAFGKMSDYTIFCTKLVLQFVYTFLILAHSLLIFFILFLQITHIFTQNLNKFPQSSILSLKLLSILFTQFKILIFLTHFSPQIIYFSFVGACILG